jgi:acetoacetyl-CoA synthetase
VRFGSAEIYDVIDTCFSASVTLKPADTIVDCLAVGQTIEGGKDERVVLFVKLLPGEMMSSELEGKIKKQIRERRSARHVPALVRIGLLPQNVLLTDLNPILLR